jgi:hypothetical protein
MKKMNDSRRLSRFHLRSTMVIMLAWATALEAHESRKTIIISDMTRCHPADALSKVPQKHRWQLIDYEAEGVKGVILGATSLKDAPDVTLPLDVEGWYAIYLGFWNPHHAYDGDFGVKLRLSDEAVFRLIVDRDAGLNWPGWFELKEVYYRSDELTGKDLVIAQQSNAHPLKSYIAYIKLVPLTNSQVEKLKADRKQKQTRCLYALNDGNGLFYRGYRTREELLEEVGIYQHSDVKGVLFAVASGEIVNYPSRTGVAWMAGPEEAVDTSGHLKLKQGVESLLQKDIVPIEVYADYLHRHNIEIHAMYRLGIIRDIPPSMIWRDDGLVARRPDLRMRDKDGTPLEKASYAYPEVRAFMLGLIREVAETYDIDGVNLGFIRGPHFVGYEDIVVKDFQDKQGFDIRTIDENDIRAQQHRADYVTEFVRSARELVDEVSKRKGSKIDLSAMVYIGEYEYNLFFGLDIKRWLDEKLLDQLFTTAPFESGFLDAARTNGCQIITHTIPCARSATGGYAECVRTAKEGHAIGVDGFWTWDMNRKQENPLYWEVLRQIGHKEAIDRYAEHLPTYKTFRLKTINGLDVGHVTNRGADGLDYWPPEMIPIYSGG